MSGVRVRVVAGWAVFHDGEQHSGGKVLTVPADLAEQWTAQQLAEPVTRKAAEPAT